MCLRCVLLAQTFCGNAQNAEIAIILNSRHPASPADHVMSPRTSTNDVDDEDDAVTLQRSYVVSDTDTVAGKVSSQL